MSHRTDLQRSLKDEELGRGIHEIHNWIKAASDWLEVDGVPNPILLIDYIIEQAKNASPDSPFVTLDIGCGTGNALTTLRKILMERDDIRAQLQFFGVDLNPIANEELHLANNIHLLQVDPQVEIPLEDESVDIGFSMATVQYMHDALRALENAYRTLKPGGRFFWVLSSYDDITWLPGLYQILDNTPGANDVFSWRHGHNDDHSVLVCQKDPESEFQGFPYKKLFALPPFIPLRRAALHKRNTVYRRVK